MVRKKSSEKNVSVKPEAVSPSEKCGDCAEAYGFCWPVLGGVPFFCRCPLHPHKLRRTSERACSIFARGDGCPAKTAVRLSECMGGPEPEKEVPLFREGERRPWKLVPVSEIPVGGISWDGTPMSDKRSEEPSAGTEEDLEW